MSDSRKDRSFLCVQCSKLHETYHIFRQRLDTERHQSMPKHDEIRSSLGNQKTNFECSAFEISYFLRRLTMRTEDLLLITIKYESFYIEHQDSRK